MISNKAWFKIKDSVLISLSTFFAIMVCIVVIFYFTSVMMEKRYQTAVELIEDQKWYQAEQALKLAPNYKDVEILERYVWANIKLELNDKTYLREQHYSPVLECLNEIPEEYQGDFKNEIREFKNYILQKSNMNEKLISDYANVSDDQLKSVKIGERYLYFEEEYIEPMFFGL